MDELIIICILFVTQNAAAMSFHELSAIFVQPIILNPDSEFGFSMGFQDTVPPKLIVGGPRSDFIGKVYSCPIIDIEETPSCQELVIDLQALANYSRAISPNQYFYLGASIAATTNYFLTCAPLWIAPPVTRKRLDSDARGTCFVYGNNTFVRYKGSYENFIGNSPPKHLTKQMISGGSVGWTTIFDDINKSILIAKSATRSDIVSIPSENPLYNSVSLSTGLYSKDHTTYDYMSKFTNIGSGLAAGNFFSNSTVYAFSMTSENMTGQIAFFKYTGQKELPMEIIKRSTTNKKDILVITSKHIGSMFGAVLCAKDLNGDGYSELIVGAPAQFEDDQRYEQGAVYIYIGGDMDINDKGRSRAILGSKEGGRFGSAIATHDVDGDGIPELFVSAPYEDTGLGAVYVLLGYEVKNSLLKQNTNEQVLLSDLKFRQKLQMKGFRTFGYSLQILSDLDNTGCNELAVGSPGNDNVVLFRCIPTIYVTLSAELRGAKFVKEQADNFVVDVCVNIEYQSSSVIDGNLIVTTDVPESGAHIPSPVFVVNLSEKRREYCNNVTVSLTREGPGVYKFNARTELDLLKNNTISDTKVFNKTWVTLREDSNTTTSIKIVKRCEDENCDPKLSMSVQGFGPYYTLGSSRNETVTVVVRNDGHDSYYSCVWVKVTGSLAGSPEKEYKYSLSSPLKRNISESIPIAIDLSHPRSTDKGLAVEVRLYDLCDQKNYTSTPLKITYELNTDHVQVNSFTKDRNITDKEILNEKSEIINDNHVYEIVNSGSVTWVNAYAIITIDKKPYIKTYNMSSPTDCQVKDVVDKMEFSCKLMLMEYSSIKAIASIGIQKDKITSNLIDGRLNITSEMTVYLRPNLTPLNKSATTIITFFKDQSIVNNFSAIILFAIILSIIVLAGVIFILNKLNFFKREQKKKLNELRESVRRKSVKKDAPGSSGLNKSDEDSCSIEVIDDSPTRASPASDDDIVLVHAVDQQEK